jgi:hypothetical protein
MAGVLTAMAQVVLAWALAFVAIAGWGRLVHRLCGPFTLTLELWLEHFWLGLAAVIAFLQIWNLFLPVNWWAAVVVAIVGFPATLVGMPRVSSLRLSRSQVLVLLLCVPVLLRVAYLSLLPPTHFDSGLYHFNMVRWHMEYPLPPGLGNLHGRLAFNISYFLYVAMMNVYPWFQHGHNIASSLWVAVLTLQLGCWIRRMILQPDQLSAPMLLRVCLLPVVLGTVGYSPISRFTYHTLASPSPDIPLFILGILLFLKFVDYLLPGELERSDNYTPLWICSVAATSITLKLNMAVFAAVILVITLGVWFWRAENRGKTLRQIVITLLAVGLLIMAPWTARSIVTSGYVCYPSTLGALRADWKVPEAQVRSMAETISNWGKGDRVSLRPDWLRHWTANYLGRPMLKWPLITLGLSCATLIGMSLRFSFNPKWLIPLLPAFLSVLYWFLTAPNVRFVGSPLWLLALWPTALALNLAAERVRLPWRSVLLVGFIAVAVAISIKPLFRRSPHFRGKLDGFAAIPTTPLEVYKTASGLQVWVPADRERKTWDAPLPAAPFAPGPKLELRGPSLAQGFRIGSGASTNDTTAPLPNP